MLVVRRRLRGLLVGNARRGAPLFSTMTSAEAVEKNELWCTTSPSEGAHPKYPRLFEPAILPASKVTLRNRVVMGSMHTGLEEKLGPSGGLDEMAAFYEERAKGGVGLIVTGGIAPNREGWVLPLAGKLTSTNEAHHHEVVTRAVHAAGGKICAQLLHAGRYAYHPMLVAPQKQKAPINVFTPRALNGTDIERTIADFARASEFAKRAGYDGVEIMGSEGYLINEFLAPKTNGEREDEWGGAKFENRSRLARRIVQDVRKAVGFENFIVVFRLSLLELVDDGMSFEEAVELARYLRSDGVDVVNSGVGWHEARVPTIATCVPRAAFAFTTGKLKRALSSEGDEEGIMPLLCATNRINDAKVAETVLSSGDADLVSMARPFLADANIVAKAFVQDEAAINTCIACNQACLDHTFKLLPVSCLVNPRAGHETSLNLTPTQRPLNIAVVGAGVAGLSCATACKERGHRVTLFEASNNIGGQFNLAARVPGKEEFKETLRYFAHQLQVLGVDLKLNTTIDDASTQLSQFDRVVVATGVSPRRVDLPRLKSESESQDSDSTKLPRVRSYAEALREGAEPAGRRVAVVGAGGIGFDVAEFLVHDETRSFYEEWGVDTTLSTRGGLLAKDRAKKPPPKREVFLLQRKATPHGVTLGKTTGWIHRAALRNNDVQMLKSVTYVGLEPGALVVDLPEEPGKRLQVDDVILCAGQTSNTSLYDALRSGDVTFASKMPPAFVIGGAEKAAELDAKRAIDQGFRLAANIDDAEPGAVFTMPTGWKAGVLDFVQTTFTPKKSSSSSSKKKKSRRRLEAS